MWNVLLDKFPTEYEGFRIDGSFQTGIQISQALQDPGLTDDEEGLRKTADFIRSLKTVQRVEVLPYHTLGLFKWQKLGIPYPLPDAVPPTAEQVKRAEELLEVSRYPG